MAELSTLKFLYRICLQKLLNIIHELLLQWNRCYYTCFDWSIIYFDCLQKHKKYSYKIAIFSPYLLTQNCNKKIVKKLAPIIPFGI